MRRRAPRAIRDVIARRRAHTEACVYAERGAPGEVLRVASIPLPDELGEDDVRVRVLAAPVNPSDVNMIEGKYPVARELPACGGNEMVGEVTACGTRALARGARTGDRVVPNRSYALGTWRREVVANANAFDVIDRDVPVHEAAMMTVNPCTALRLLVDNDAREGDTIVVNAATSGVGRALLQLARARGIRTIAMCRPRSSETATEEVFESLRADGADVVIPDVEGKFLRLDAKTRELATRARFGFNAVSGYSAQTMLRLLQPNASSVMVTYGGMSKQPLVVPTGAFIFKDITLKGFWLTRWLEHDEKTTQGAGRRDMLAQISREIRDGALRTPSSRLRDVPLRGLPEALRLDAAADLDPSASIGRLKILVRC
jgi:trans-2-enoyl-CoA reductase